MRKNTYILNRLKSVSFSEGFQNGGIPCQVRGYCVTAVYRHGSQTEKKENTEALLEARAMSGAKGSHPFE